jgi:hypothetical protein
MGLVWLCVVIKASNKITHTIARQRRRKALVRGINKGANGACQKMTTPASARAMIVETIVVASCYPVPHRADEFLKFPVLLFRHR